MLSIWLLSRHLSSLKLHLCVINSSDILCKNPWLRAQRHSELRQGPETNQWPRPGPEMQSRYQREERQLCQHLWPVPVRAGRCELELDPSSSSNRLLTSSVSMSSWKSSYFCQHPLLKISNEQWRLPGCVPPGLHIRSGKVGRTFYVLRDMMIKIKIIFQESPVSTSSCLIQFTPEATSLRYTLSGMHLNHT